MSFIIHGSVEFILPMFKNGPYFHVELPRVPLTSTVILCTRLTTPSHTTLGLGCVKLNSTLCHLLVLFWIGYNCLIMNKKLMRLISHNFIYKKNPQDVYPYQSQWYNLMMNIFTYMTLKLNGRNLRRSRSVCRQEDVACGVCSFFCSRKTTGMMARDLQGLYTLPQRS